MSRAPTPEDEFTRLAALQACGILDTSADPAFDALTRIAAHVCDTPIAVINFIDRERQWFKSEIGLGVRETPLDISICAHAILQPGLFVVPDTFNDPRFSSNPLVSGDPHLRFYAGALLETRDGQRLGTLCVLDHQPRQLTDEQGEILQALAGQVMLLLDLYRHNARQGEMLVELDLAQRKMEHLAATDPLTGLANRRAFNDRLTQEIARLSRNSSTACLLMADLDHFKRVNDEHGHQTGDHALHVFAATCMSIFRESDYIGRWGGEEFVVLLPDTGLDDATQVTARLHKALSRTPISGIGESFVLSVSVGIIEIEPGMNADQLIGAADHALYLAKNAGRSRTHTA